MDHFSEKIVAYIHTSPQTTAVCTQIDYQVFHVYKIIVYINRCNLIDYRLKSSSKETQIFVHYFVNESVSVPFRCFQ